MPRRLRVLYSLLNREWAYFPSPAGPSRIFSQGRVATSHHCVHIKWAPGLRFAPLRWPKLSPTPIRCLRRRHNVRRYGHPSSAPLGCLDRLEADVHGAVNFATTEFYEVRLP